MKDYIAIQRRTGKPGEPGETGLLKGQTRRTQRVTTDKRP